jgi:hypothetical protein
MIQDFPFHVEQHDTMVLCAPGVRPETVLTIEQMLYSWRICEYSDPLFIGRAWWYDTVVEALEALGAYATLGGDEPPDWLRADDFDEQGMARTRRVHLEAGERVITTDPPFSASIAENGGKDDEAKVYRVDL